MGICRKGIDMVKLQEKRHHPRHHGQGQITLLHTYYDTRQMKGGLINFSEQGIRFFSDRPLTPGTTILVRVCGENYRHISADIDCQLRSMGFCTIKWCQEVIRLGIPCHEMGAVYVMSY
jgi:hypothetical protein